MCGYAQPSLFFSSLSHLAILHGLLSNTNIRIPTKFGDPLTPETWHEALSNKHMRIPHPTKKWGPPLPPALCEFGAEKGGIIKG